MDRPNGRANSDARIVICAGVAAEPRLPDLAFGAEPTTKRLSRTRLPPGLAAEMQVPGLAGERPSGGRSPGMSRRTHGACHLPSLSSENIVGSCGPRDFPKAASRHKIPNSIHAKTLLLLFGNGLRRRYGEVRIAFASRPFHPRRKNGAAGNNLAIPLGSASRTHYDPQ